MQATFNITEQDYVKSAIINGEPTRKTKIFHFTVDALLILAGTLSFLNGNYALAGAMFGTAIGAVILPFSIKKLFGPLLLKRHYKKYRQIQRSISVQLTTDGIFYSTDSGTALLKWADIFSWRESSEYILVYVAPKIYHILPTRLIELGFPIEDLKTALHNNVGAAT